MRKHTKLFAVLFALMMVTSSAFAAQSPWVDNGSYADQAKGKLAYGAKNFLGGWTQLITEPKNNEGGPLAGLFLGIYNAAIYTVGGALHIATFPITAVDVPIPNGGVSL